MDREEALKWYEQKWEEDYRRWEEEKRVLEKRLEEQAVEILALKRGIVAQESQAIRTLESQVEELKRRLEEERTARGRCEEALQRVKRQLEVTSRPPLSEGFFSYLAQAVELWDLALIEEARKLSGNSLEPWLKGIWKEREEALFEGLGGEAPDWRRVRTGLVLEWALLTWLEGIRGG